MKNQKPEIEKVDISSPESLASEMYRELKYANIFMRKIIVIMGIIIGVLVAGMIALSGYHIYQWSQFDTVVVDTGEGGGNANYIQGDNQGGIFNNGESSSSQAQEGEVPGNTD